jgi:phosphoglycerate-specific signal transduction histidine kinase
MTRTLLSAAAVLAALTTGALADRIDQRQADQAQRIEQARRSGELTRSETNSLRAEQARIADLERRAKSDGVVTRNEARTIANAQNAASRHIYQESHDSQRSWYRRWF